MSDEFLPALLALPDGEQRAYLAARADSLGEMASSPDSDTFADALKARADETLRSDIQRSLHYAGLLLYAGQLTGNPFFQAMGLRAEANAHAIGLGDYALALQLYDQAASIYHAHGRTLDEARAQIGKVWPLANLGRYDEAFRCGDWVGRILEAHAEWRPLATLTMNMAIIHGRLAQDARALELFDKARDLYLRIGASEHIWVEQNRAEVLRNLGRFDESIAASLAAQRGLTELGHQVEVARAKHNLAITYFVLGRYNEALALLDQAQAAYVADGRTRDAMEAELFMSDCLLQLRRFAEALDRCRQARARFAELGARFEVAQAYVNEAIAHTGLRHDADALAALEQARSLFEAEGNAVWQAITGLEVSAVLTRQGQSQAAVDQARACADVFHAHGLPVREAQAQLALAQAAHALGNDDAARASCEAALAAGREKDIPWLVYPAHALLGAMARQRGDADLAAGEYERAIEALERLRGRLMVEYRAGYLEDKQDVYEQAVDLQLERGQPQRAFEIVERAKSRALHDLIAQRLDVSLQPRNAGDEPLVAELARLRAERDQLARRLEAQRQESWGENRLAAEADWQQAQERILAMERQITQQWHRLLVRNAGYARDAALLGAPLDAPWQAQAGSIQSHLADDTLLIEFFTIREQVLVFLVRRDGIRVRRLPADARRIQQTVRGLWLNVSTVPNSTAAQIDRLADQARKLLRQLYELLLAPVAEDIAGRRHLILVPHGGLHYLPFQALCDDRGYLLERHEVSYLPSASLLPHVQRNAGNPGGIAAAFGVSLGGALPQAVEEARAVAGLLHGRAYVEDQATVAQLRESAQDAQVIHVAAHGDFRADNPLFSELSLAGGGLTTLDAFGLRTRASLVTLSACQTGRSVVGGGDELLGLMRAFLSAGAASLVLGLWRVADRAALELMTAFYSGLTGGLTKADALRRAQLALALAYPHPFFWAPFFLVGDPGALPADG